jgi:hypothetical protein
MNKTITTEDLCCSFPLRDWTVNVVRGVSVFRVDILDVYDTPVPKFIDFFHWTFSPVELACATIGEYCETLNELAYDRPFAIEHAVVHYDTKTNKQYTLLYTTIDDYLEDFSLSS